MATAGSSAPGNRPTGALGDFQPKEHTPTNTYRKVRESLGAQDRIAVVITGAIGTMYAVYFLATFMAGWILLQVLLGRAAFDPYPFAFLLFLGNIVQLLLMPLLMVGQNLQGRHIEVRAEEEFHTVTKIFHDMGQTMRHLDAQDAELLRQSRLLVGLVESLVPEDRRTSLLGPVSDDPRPTG
ncbi:MAG: DUF1003 domain-containing protein [Chloroflexota bacterium]